MFRSEKIITSLLKQAIKNGLSIPVDQAALQAIEEHENEADLGKQCLKMIIQSAQAEEMKIRTRFSLYREFQIEYEDDEEDEEQGDENQSEEEESDQNYQPSPKKWKPLTDRFSLEKMERLDRYMKDHPTHKWRTLKHNFSWLESR